MSNKLKPGNKICKQLQR